MANSKKITLKMDARVVADMKDIAAQARMLGGPELAREYRAIIKDKVIEPLAAAARVDAVSQGSHAARVAPTIKTRVSSLSTGSAGVPYWAGAVFGGQKDAKRTYIGRRGDRRFVVRRRTTMQFRPHRGRNPYVLFPVWDRLDSKLSADLAEASARFLAERVT